MKKPPNDFTGNSLEPDMDPDPWPPSFSEFLDERKVGKHRFWRRDKSELENEVGEPLVQCDQCGELVDKVIVFSKVGYRELYQTEVCESCLEKARKLLQ